MIEEWRIVQKTESSTLKQLWVRLRSGLWVPTERFMCDAQMMPLIQGGSPGTVDKQVAVGGDDGYRWGGTSFDNADDYVIAGFQTYHSFARFTGVTIEGTIDVSYIECHYRTHSGAPELKVRGVDEDNPAAPTTYQEFDADPLTWEGVDWDGAWTSDPVWNQSPSLNAIFQELVNSYTISNEAVMIQVRYDASPTAYASYHTQEYNNNTYGPKLHIEFTPRRIFITHQ